MKHIIIALAAFCATPAVAEDLAVHLADGATWTITAEHTRQTEGMGAAQNWSLTTVKRLTWHAGGKGKPDTLTVTPMSAVPGAGSPAELAGARSLAIPATLVVSENLEPGEVVNRDEVRAEFVRLLPSAREASKDIIDASSKAMIATELATASRGQGFVLKLAQPVSADGSLPNPLGGPAMRMVETAELAAIDSKHGRAIIKWRQGLDPESFKASTTAMLAKMMAGKLEPAKLEEARTAFATASMTNETECLYEIDMRTGLARRGDCSTKSSISMQGKIQKIAEHWTISQSEPGT